MIHLSCFLSRFLSTAASCLISGLFTHVHAPVSTTVYIPFYPHGRCLLISGNNCHVEKLSCCLENWCDPWKTGDIDFDEIIVAFSFCIKIHEHVLWGGIAIGHPKNSWSPLNRIFKLLFVESLGPIHEAMLLKPLDCTLRWGMFICPKTWALF